MQNPKNTAPSVTRFPLVRAKGDKARRIHFMRPTLRKLDAQRRIIERGIARGKALSKDKPTPLLSYWDGQRRLLFGYLIQLRDFCRHPERKFAP